MPLPVLTTERLTLRPATTAETDRLWQHWIHPDVRRYMFDDRAMPREEAAAWLEAQTAHGERGLGVWAIEEAAGTFLGHVSLVPADVIAALDPTWMGEVEFGIGIEPEFWGRGYALEALDKVLAHGLGAAGLARILGAYHEPNVASRKLQEKAGFVRLGVIRGPVHPIVISEVRAG